MVQTADFIYEKDKTQVVFITPYGTSFPEVIEKLQADPLIQVVECSGSLEAVSLVQKFKRSLILFHGSEFDDIVKNVTMLKVLKDEISSHRVRAIMTTRVIDEAILSKFRMYGCSEIIQEPVNARALLFKIQRHLRVLEQHHKSIHDHSKENQTKELKTSKKPTKKLMKRAVLDVHGSPMFRMVAALEFQSDFWSLRDEPPKQIGGRWVVRLNGPHRSVGQWIQGPQGSKGSSQEIWIWKPLDFEHHPYIQEDGQWRFHGQKPEYKRGCWWFVGAELELNYYENEKLIGSKIARDHFEILILARNSPAGLDALEMIKSEESKKSSKSRELDEHLSPFIRQALEPGNAAQETEDSIKDVKKDETDIQDLRKNDAQETPEIRDLRSPTQKSENPDLIRVETQYFGHPHGKWEFVCNRLGGEKWYIYVPFEIKNNLSSALDIRKLSRYSWYQGPSDPTLDHSSPQLFWLFFKNSPEDVASFDLLDSVIRKFLIEKYTSSPDYLDQNSDGTSSGPEIVDTQEVGTELKLEPSKAPPSNKASPLALSLWVSEMVCRPRADLKRVSSKFCTYLGLVFEGVRIELWYFKAERWACAGTIDGSPEKFETSLVNVEPFPQITDQGTLIIPITRSKSKVREELKTEGDKAVPENEEMIGAVVFGGAVDEGGVGTDISSISIDSAQGYCIMSQGIFRYWIDRSAA